VTGLNQVVVRSENLRLVPSRRGGFVAYHTLFGHLKHIDAGTAELLETCSDPRPVAGVISALASRGVPAAEAGGSLDRLQRLHYLVPPEGDVERAMVAEWQRRREADIASGRFARELELSISDLCNFKCQYCFADIADELSEDRRRLHRSKERLMSFETATKTIAKMLDLARNNGRDRLLVKFIGREPLLNADVMDQVMDHFGAEDRGVALHYDVTTNCSLLTPEVAAHLGRHGATVNVSIDIPGEGNDLTRVTRDGEGTFALVDRTVGLLKEHNIQIVLNSVFTKDNFPYLDESLLDYAARRGLPLVNLIPVLAMDDVAAHTHFPNEVICDRLEGLYRYSKTVDIRLRGYWFNAVAKLISSRSKGFFDRIDDRASCVAYGNQLNVEPSGDVFSCRMSGARLGHIDDLEGLLSGPEYRHYIMRTFAPACRGCDIEGFCHGLCAGHMEKYFQDVHQVDRGYCDMYTEMTRRVLANL